MTLPKGWTRAKLAEFTLERVEQGEPGASAVPYIDIGSIDRDLKRVGLTEKVTRANAPTRARQWVKPGDVLVSLTRPNLNAVALVPPELDGAVASTGFDVLRSQGILPEWVFNRVRSQAFVSDVCEGVQGVVYPAIRPADVRQHDLQIPPAQEQRRIVEAIDSYLTRLDDAVASLERVQAKLKAYRASVLKAAVEGRLVPTEAALARAEKRDYEPADALLAHIFKERCRRWEEAELAKLKAAGKTTKDDKWKAKYEEPVAPDRRTLPELPEGWCWATLDVFLYGIESGKNFRCVERPPNREEVGVVKVSAVTWGTFDEDESKTCTRPELINEDDFIRTGDFLFSRANTIELVGACVIAGNIAKTLMLSDKILRLRLVGGADRWLLWCLRSFWGRREIQSLATGNQESMRNISQRGLRRIRVPLPPDAELQRIVAEMERQLSTEQATKEAIAADLRRCARLRQAILKWAFEGKLVDQDPNDEPADELLARIQAEHAVDVPTETNRGRKAKGAT